MLRLKSQQDLHLTRKIFHFTGVMAMFILLDQFSFTTCLWIYGILGSSILLLDFGRQYSKPVNRWAVKVFNPVLRKREAFRLSGTTHLVVGCGIIFFLFPTPIVALAVLFLAVGDPTASLFGLLFGHDKLIGNKSLQGSVAAFLFCSVAAYFYFQSHGIMLDHILVVTFLAGLIGAIAELVPIWGLDDNLTQPVLSAILLSGLFFLFGGLV
ncbi:MAG: hypothetical protein KDD33_00315 [Bdellovibrionales bacterium]|nr:hypothetical protein [Bdellovibrionales bacterium]